MTLGPILGRVGDLAMYCFIAFGVILLGWAAYRTVKDFWDGI